MTGTLRKAAVTGRSRIFRVLSKSPIQPIRRQWGRRRLRVLAYHEVADRATFEEHLEHLAAHYMPIGLDDVIGWIDGAPLPPNPVLLTFDDGHRSWVESAVPAMRRRGIPGVAFVVTGVVGTRTPYWWEEVAARLGGAAQQVVAELKTVPDRERIARLENLRLEGGTIESDTNLTSDDLLVLENANIEVGNHTVTHPILDRCPIEKITHEIRAAATELAEILGRPIRAFAYPNGSWNPAVREAVADAGHLVAFLFDHREQVWPVPDPLTISRIRVNSTDPIEEFAIRVSGLHSTMMHVRSRLG